MVIVTQKLLAESSLLGMGLDGLGGLYLAYDLLGGKHGPLRIIGRATGYIALFFLGYATVLGLRYAIVAATGMGALLAVEFRLAAANGQRPERNRVLLFGFFRGVVLGLAGMSIAGATFGAVFGLLSGMALMIVYSFDFAPTDDYVAHIKPRLSRHNLLASALRAIGISIAGVVAGHLVLAGAHATVLGLKLGLAAGTVSALVGLFSPAIEWWIDNLPERRLGVLGLGFIFLGMVLQSMQYWLVVFGIPVR